jgi:K+-sensing histidine kinase KdpD
MADQRREHEQRPSPEALLQAAAGKPKLGLAISRGFVEPIHGMIVAGNRTGRTGAAFTIRLPVPPQVQTLDTAA